ncbi:hypothetical protein [Actinomadura opuntiae]|uniref:hypothetical protein n=1 Tax=Actinomadura sp. OS1-43 TaxID=604315 RepID=UPI00255B1E10|nr:hypothetical protein [Actinomadura sp. OS1-43]MDL4819084.1 hypothetical protein [Actinomadura sp. OS1-43]
MTSPAVSFTKNRTARTERGDETTRMLCAAAYHDRRFQSLVVRHVLLPHQRAVAPSYGFDLVPVADHAWRAFTLDTVQHATVLTVFVLAALQSPSAAITAGCLLGLWSLSGYASRLAPEVVRSRTRKSVNHFCPWLKNDERPREEWLWIKGPPRRDLDEQTRRLKLSLYGCGLLVAAPVLSASIEHTPLHLMAVRAVVPLLLCSVVTVMVAAVRHRSMVLTQEPGPLRPDQLNRRLAAIDVQQTDPVIAYRRPRPPKRDPDTGRPDFYDFGDDPNFFVGSGQLVHRWLPPLAIQLLRPQTVDLTKGKKADDMTRRGYVHPPFRADELVTHLRKMMRPIGHSSDPIRLPGYRISDRYYVEEADAPEVRRQLAELGDAAFRRKVVNTHDGKCQHFLEMRVTSSGELVTTVFVRVTLKGRSLSLDFAACALTRTPRSFHRAARRARSGRTAAVLGALSTLGDLPGEVARCWQALAVLLRLPLYVEAFTKCTVRGSAPRFSVREVTAATWQEAAFDEPAILDQMKIIELRLLQVTKDFLRARNVDTSVFEKRAETIISASVLNMGGRVDINNSAVGNNAQVNQNAQTSQPSAQKAAK